MLLINLNENSTSNYVIRFILTIFWPFNNLIEFLVAIIKNLGYLKIKFVYYYLFS